MEAVIAATADGLVQYVVSHVAPALLGDRELMQNGNALQYASAGVKADREVVAAATAQTYHAAYFAAAELRSDVDFMLSLVQLYPDNATARQYIINQAAEGIRAELAARADPDVGKAAGGVRR